ncbi:MAG TPA: hypothetical protein VGG74_27110 [Kofleriaceae bacterium]|jgi:hypothetical protein
MVRVVRTLAAMAIALAGCGRFDFALRGGSGGDTGPTSIDAIATGSASPRYAEILDGNGGTPLVAGTQGEVAVAETFVASTTIAGSALTGQAMYESWGLVWLDGSGAPASSSVLDSTSVCELRALASAGSGVIAAGIAESGATMPALGACAIATARQDGVAISVATDGGQALEAHLASSSMNDQSWHAAAFGDGTIAADGIYGAAGTLGSQMLPSTTSDENAWFARVDPTTGEPRWVTTVTTADDDYAGPIDADGDELCMMGSFSNTVTVLGTQLTSAGGTDEWVARVDATGAPKFVRQIGTTGAESTTMSLAIVATADGGCTASFDAGGDLVLDTMSLPLADGPAVLLHFGPTGALSAGQRLAEVPILARVAGGTYAAMPCTRPCELGGATYTPVASDVAIFTLDDALEATPIAAVTGGVSALYAFAGVPPDALAIGFSFTAATTFGATVLPDQAMAENAIAVLGVAP